MTTERPRPATGVAKGSLGTGTALDDTQVYQVSDLAPPPPAPDPVEALTPETAPVRSAVRPAVRRRRAGFATGVPGAGWIAGTALVAVVVTAIVSTGLGAGHPGENLGSGAPAAVVPTLAAPSAAPTEATGSGKGKGNGKGKGGGN